MSSSEIVAPRDRRELLEEFDRRMRMLVSQSVLFHHAVADRVGLNVSDLNCLGILEMTGPTTPGSLAEQTGLTTGAITGALDRLEAGGYVRRDRDPRDRRRILVVPLEIPADIYALFASLGNATEELCEHYSDEQLALLVDFVGRAAPMTQAETAKLRASGARPGAPARTESARTPG